MSALLDPSNRRTTTAKWGLVIHTAVMFIVVMICSALAMDQQRISYIDKREFPGVDSVLPPGPLGYHLTLRSDAISFTPYLLFFLNQCLADGFLVSPVKCSVAQVFNICHSSALPLLHHLLHELLGHFLPMPHVYCFYGYVFMPLQVDSEAPN